MASMFRVRVAALLAGALTIVGGGSALASARGFSAGDQAVANAAILHRSDLGTVAGWKGGVQKVDLSKASGTLTSSCPGYGSSGIESVLTGAAASRFSNGGLVVLSSALVVRDAGTGSRDLRGMHGSVFQDCMRRLVGTFFEADSSKVSIARLALPNVATATVAYRGTATYATTTRRYVMDIVAFRRGRSEGLIAVVLPAADGSLAREADLLYSRIVAARLP